MLSWALTFLVITIVAGVLGFCCSHSAYWYTAPGNTPAASIRCSSMSTSSPAPKRWTTYCAVEPI